MAGASFGRELGIRILGSHFQRKCGPGGGGEVEHIWLALSFCLGLWLKFLFPN